jgi:hypothetical protein
MKLLFIILLASTSYGCASIFSAADIHKGDRQAVKVESNIDKVETTGIKTDKIENKADVKAGLVNTEKTDNSVNVNNPKWLFWTNVINGAYSLAPFVLTLVLLTTLMQLMTNKQANITREYIKQSSESMDLLINKIDTLIFILRSKQ